MGPRAVVTGGAGFVGSHLCERLLADGWRVLCIDSGLTGDQRNLRTVSADPRFALRSADVTEPIEDVVDVQAVLHFASPASPIDYDAYPIETLRAGAFGTYHALELARRCDARFLLASTSEVYGDPEVHPQPESYWGRVNPIGPRSVYDEAKRYAEALATAYGRRHGIVVQIARIFNTYGPRMRRRDGRAVPTFISQALHGEPLTVHGDGSQTRSLCFISDLVEGAVRLLASEHVGPINLDNPDEISVLELAQRVQRLTGTHSPIEFTARPVDDPSVRCPDISLAKETLGWVPRVSLDGGLNMTIQWAREDGWGAC